MLLISILFLVAMASTAQGISYHADTTHKLEVTLRPKVGRDESADIQSIHELINNAYGVYVEISVKEVGNSVIVAVLKIRDACNWTPITRQLSQEGHEFTITPLFSCHKFAKELHVFMLPNVPLMATHISQVSFPFNGMPEAEYLDKVATFLKRITQYAERTNTSMMCFRHTLHLPLRLVLFSNEASSVDFKLMKALGQGLNYDAELRYSQDLGHYTNTCLGFV